MAEVYRQVYTTFWQDSFVISLTPEEKYFYLYLITNSKTTLCGIYELPIQVAVFETGYNRETIEKLIEKFENYRKIKYSRSTFEVCVVNFTKYNTNRSPKVQTAVDRAFSNVKDKSLIPYAYGIDTVSTDTDTDTDTDTVTDTGENKFSLEPPQKSKIISYTKIQELYNQICKSYPKCNVLSDARKKAIKARANNGYEIEDFKKLFEKAEASEFLKGKNNRNWSANMDWLIKDANMAKVLDGNYDSKNKIPTDEDYTKGLIEGVDYLSG